MMSSATSSSCRACLKESLEECYFEMNKQCYFSTNEQNFGDIFNFCTKLQVEINDGFPQRICKECAQVLQQTYEFLQKVLASDKKLNEMKRDNEVVIHDNDDSLKDPLENATDNEQTLDKDNTSDIIEDDNEDEYSRTLLDNVDNTVEDPHQQHHNSTLSSPHYSDSNSTSSSNDDKAEGDFFKSVESQIFPQGRLKCKICHKAYFTNKGLEAHMDIHLPKGKTISKSSLLVGKFMKNKKKILKNTDISEEDDENNAEQNAKTKLPKPKKTFPCEVCGKQMISASKLRYHMVMHTGEKDYLCTMCPKAYSTIYALKHHMRAHTGERPYECKFCGDRFLRPTTLKSHMRRHTGERPYGCDICGKRFIQHSSMATHMKLNHMDKTIPCPYCDKKYARQTDLNTHLLSHSGDKPFACQMCPSRFTRQSNLNKHMNQQHYNNDNNSVGDKKSKKKNTKEVVLSTEFNEQQIGESDNKDSLFRDDCVVERPSCSSHFNSTSLKHQETETSSITSFQQMSAIANAQPVNQLNNWDWPNQT